jgi:hypothetical protein
MRFTDRQKKRFWASTTTAKSVDVDVVFPSGSIRFGAEELYAIGRNQGGGWDVDLIAQAFRAHVGERLVKLRGAKLISAWTGFCEGWVTRRGRA